MSEGANAPAGMPRRRAPLRGHAWTIAGPLRDRLLPVRAPVGEPWQTTLVDPQRGAVRLTGVLRAPPAATTLALLVHGLGGSADSYYMRGAASELHRRGIASLALSLRGADRSGEDVYHAGLTADLEAAFASPALAQWSTIHLLGFSLGGHVALRWALSPSDARVRSVAAVCTPLDLAAAQQNLDRPRAALYRRHVLNGLREIQAAVAARCALPAPDLRGCRTFREWDQRVVVPRFGFGDVQHYYESMSVAPHLRALALRSLLMFANGDPMVPPQVVVPSLANAGSRLEVRWTRRGGHLGFPRDLDFGLPGERGLIGQIAAFWARG